jgi:hypothetical protein
MHIHKHMYIIQYMQEMTPEKSRRATPRRVMTSSSSRSFTQYKPPLQESAVSSENYDRFPQRIGAHGAGIIHTPADARRSAQSRVYTCSSTNIHTYENAVGEDNTEGFLHNNAKEHGGVDYKRPGIGMHEKYLGSNISHISELDAYRTQDQSLYGSFSPCPAFITLRPDDLYVSSSVSQSPCGGWHDGTSPVQDMHGIEGADAHAVAQSVAAAETLSHSHATQPTDTVTWHVVSTESATSHSPRVAEAHSLHIVIPYVTAEGAPHLVDAAQATATSETAHTHTVEACVQESTGGTSLVDVAVKEAGSGGNVVQVTDQAVSSHVLVDHERAAEAGVTQAVGTPSVHATSDTGGNSGAVLVADEKSMVHAAVQGAGGNSHVDATADEIISHSTSAAELASAVPVAGATAAHADVTAAHADSSSYTASATHQVQDALSTEDQHDGASATDDHAKIAQANQCIAVAAAHENGIAVDGGNFKESARLHNLVVQLGTDDTTGVGMSAEGVAQQEGEHTAHTSSHAPDSSPARRPPGVPPLPLLTHASPRPPQVRVPFSARKSFLRNYGTQATSEHAGSNVNKSPGGYFHGAGGGRDDKQGGAGYAADSDKHVVVASPGRPGVLHSRRDSMNDAVMGTPNGVKASYVGGTGGVLRVRNIR